MWRRDCSPNDKNVRGYLCVDSDMGSIIVTIPRIVFIAEYDDGSKQQFQIDRWALKSGEHVAWLVAGERQRDGFLKAGEIIRVYRDPAIAYLER
jgi:hypothetical protein